MGEVPTGQPQTNGVPRLALRFDEVVSAFERIPLPGQGDTYERFEILASLAQEDLSLARLAEGHADALAILFEAGLGHRHTESRYGVWAARGGVGDVLATPVAEGWGLVGTKSFCSGSGMLDRALVTAEAPDGYRLFDVGLSSALVRPVPNSWPAVGMADSRSETVTFDGLFVGADDAVGPPGYYTERPGFWFGACGVAACWFGGGRGLVSGVMEKLGGDASESVLSGIGSAAGFLQAADSSLRHVAGAIDADPEDKDGRAQERALTVRLIVHECCEAVLRLTAAAGGARPLCQDPAQARRAADLYVYLAQHHGGADTARLGRILLQRRP